MEENKGYIGVFDSGVGGLTVAKQLIKQLPSERIIYLGDTARVPYGIKSKETVIKFAKECVNFLLSFNLKAVVIACNTASSYALSELKTNLDLPVFGVIMPGVEKAVNNTKNNKIGVIGTRATINSESYKSAILNIDRDINVFQKSCSLFVSLAEEGWIDNEVTYKTAEKYLSYFKDKFIDTLILGCTHYPILKKVISDVIGKQVTLIDSAKEVADCVKEELEEKGILAESIIGENKFFVTDETQRFIKISKLFFGISLNEVSRIDLDGSQVTERVKS